MEKYTREELKNLIKEAIREVLKEEEVILKNDSPLLDSSINSLGLSNKLLKALAYRQIYNVRDLINLTIFDIGTLRNVGEKGVEEVQGKLKAHNLSLRV